jgi:hypothetical protein
VIPVYFGDLPELKKAPGILIIKENCSLYYLVFYVFIGIPGAAPGFALYKNAVFADIRYPE